MPAASHDCVMGPFRLTTISNIQALSLYVPTAICPSGAPIDASRCFMAQRVTRVPNFFFGDAVRIYRSEDNEGDGDKDHGLIR